MPSLSLGLSLRGQLINSSFSPSYLFAASEPGIWFDPSDMTTLFQDSFGTTPVTAPSQSVGLMLDKSQGLALGPELVTNGTFDGGTTTGWTAASSAVLSVSGGSLVVTNGAVAFGHAVQAITTVVGRYYSVSFSVTGGSNTGNLYIGTTSGGFENYNSPNRGVGTYQIVFLATATTTYIRVGVSVNTSGATVNFDNISVKLLAGNHATQSTAGNRPVYAVMPKTGIRNLLTYTERFDNAAWTKSNVSVSADAAIAPDGTTTADLLSVVSNSFAVSYQNTAVAPTSATTSIWIKAGTVAQCYLGIYDGTNFGSSATASIISGPGTATQVSGSLTSITGLSASQWTRISITRTTFAGNAGIFIYLRNNSSAVAGDTLYVWGAQLELGSTVTSYQQVVSKYEVTEAGVQTLPYLSFNGATSSMVTPTITPGIDKAQVFAGVRKLSDAATGIVVELSPNTSTNTGGMWLTAPISGPSSSYDFTSKGTNGASATYINAAVAAPKTSVLAGIGDIGAPNAVLRVNNAQVAQSVTSQGTGNYLAYPLYIGARAGTSLFFNGNLYGLIVRLGVNLSAARISQMENFMNQKTGAY